MDVANLVASALTSWLNALLTAVSVPKTSESTVTLPFLSTLTVVPKTVFVIVSVFVLALLVSTVALIVTFPSLSI